VTVQLLIRDGNPWWYLSPDIWVVPGNDPNGTPGSPVAGQSAYLWARVQNNGDTDAANVRLDYYWADPTMQVARSTAHFVGSAFATVPAGTMREALCVVPWVPTIVNDGHECLVVTATHPLDPLPGPLPDVFDPPTYRQVAQKNLTVLEMSTKTMSLMLTLSGLQRVDKQVLVVAEIGGELPSDMLAGLGLEGWKPAHGNVEVGLSLERGCVGDNEPLGERRLELRAPRGTAAALNLAVRADGLPPHEYELVHIEERIGDSVLGGCALVVVAAPEKGKR
jgi:hypothetical protein